MRSDKAFAALGFALILCVFLAACGGGSKPAPARSPVIFESSLPNGAVNVPYNATVHVTQGTGTSPFTWSIISGNLPVGLSLNSGTGAITGTPTAIGNVSFTVQVTDAKSLTGTKNLSINIRGAVSITPASLPGGAVSIPYNATLTATGGVLPYTWSVSSGTLPAGLTLTTNADSTATISGTPTLLGTSTFTIQVADAEIPPATGTSGPLSIAIEGSLTITTTSLPGGNVAFFYDSQLMATGGKTPYTWSITSGTLPPGLSLTPSTGVISGTPTTTGSYPITVQVTDADSNTASANLSITITGKLQGTFAFSFNGLDNGQPFYTAGSFTGDGAGNLRGVLDQNGLGAPGVITKAPFTGTYSIGSSGLGTLTFTIPALGVTYTYDFAPSLTGDTKFILADSTHPQIYGSGVIKAQSLASLTGLTSLSGNYAMGFFGVDPTGNRSAGAGFFKADSSGNLTSGIEDTNDNGTVHSQTAFTGSWALDANFATTGRGTATLNVGATARHYAFYVVNPKNELIEVQTDPVSGGASLSLVSVLKALTNVTGGGGFNNLLLNNSAVMELTGYTGGSSPLPEVSLGVSTFDGKGNITLFQTDENKGGTYTENTFTGTYNVETTTGRVTVAGLGTGRQPVWYLVSPNQGFVIGTDSSVTQGSFEPQSGAPFSLRQFLLSYAGGTIQPVLAGVTNEVDSTIIPAPGGTIVITYDTSGSGGPQMDLPPLSLMYALDPTNGATTGRFILTPLPGSAGPMEIVYMITAAATGSTGSTDLSKNKWASINITSASGAPDPNPRLTVVQSTHQ